ncbi:MAG: hypothetical protein JOZ81_33255 [Chloroflexi bacterium]|nr:hypothetical protein [Chloroflexota bacterium]
MLSAVDTTRTSSGTISDAIDVSASTQVALRLLSLLFDCWASASHQKRGFRYLSVLTPIAG